MGKNSFGQWYGGRGHVWNVPMTKNLVPSKEWYSCCASWMNPKKKDCPDDENLLGHPLLERC